MGLRKMYMAPSIQAMESGQPWIVPGNQFRRHSTSRVTHLESIHTLIQSTGNETPHTIDLRQAECPRKSSFRGSAQELTSDRDTTPSLVVPEVAKLSSGGCFDMDNWVFRIVWKHTHHMGTLELMQKFFYREDRGKYGEHHTSTRGVPDLSGFEEDAGPKARGSNNHRYQERGRRVRHRCLQRESDGCTPKFATEMVQKELPVVKQIIKQTHEKQKASMSAGSDEISRRQGVKAQATNTVRKLGKDDQLTAALFSQYMAFILIARLQEDLNEARDEIEDANEKIELLAKELQDVKLESNQCEDEVECPHEDAEAAHWQQRFEKSEAEKQALEDEVMSLRRQLHPNNRRESAVPFMHDSLPPPLANTGERTTMTGIKLPSLSPMLIQGASEMHQRKRKRSALEPPTVAIQINGQHRLPLSPAPSYDGSPSPSIYSG